MKSISQVYSYIQARAAWEGVPFSLPKLLFARAFADGCRDFFSVALDHDGNLVRDMQHPAFFAQYLAAREEMGAS